MKIITLAESIESLSYKENITDGDIRICIQNFLHYIKTLKNDPAAIEEIFKTEPKFHTDIPDYVYAYAAALTETISAENNISAPDWINKDIYFLQIPWFPEGTENFPRLKNSLIKNSPEPFKKRNLFVSKNALEVF